MGSTLTPTRNRKLLDLPFLQQQHNRLDTETETKFKKIMQKNGIITINGQQYHTKSSELEDLDELGNGTSGHVVRMRHKPSNAIIAVKVRAPQPSIGSFYLSLTEKLEKIRCKDLVLMVVRSQFT
jgi:mitogen-activated protein kinase kinase 7